MEEIPTVKQRFINNRHLIIKGFDTIVISLFMMFTKFQAHVGVEPVTGNYFIAHAVGDIGLSYISLCIGLFTLYVAFSKHYMVKAKEYTYFAILFSWSSYFALFLYKYVTLNGSLLSVIFIALILISILSEMLVGDWSDHP